MKTIRTTVTMPVTLHQRLRRTAFQEHISLNEVILAKLRDKNEHEYSTESIEEKIKDDFAFFDKIAERHGK